MDGIGEKQICSLAIGGIECQLSNLKVGIKDSEVSDFVKNSLRGAAGVYIHGISMITYNCKSVLDEEDNKKLNNLTVELIEIRDGG